MGLFDSEPEDEVEISPEENDSEVEGKLRDEVESEIVGEEKSTSSKNRRGKAIREKSLKGDTGNKSGEVTLEDVHRQNKKIIGMLEDIRDEGSGEDMEGDLNGVL